MINDYVSVVYDETRTPKTDYPSRLASYLCKRFSIKKGARLLEIGCGRGDFLEAFQSLGIECYGIDLCESGLKNICNLNLNVQKLDISKDTIPFDNDTFDIVYHKSLIEHLFSPNHLMTETYRVLKRGGRTIILAPDWISQMKVFYEDFTHFKPYDVNALFDLLKIYGFSEVKTELFYQLPILWHYPVVKILSKFLQFVISTKTARELTRITGIKIFRWSVELMILGTGVK